MGFIHDFYESTCQFATAPNAPIEHIAQIELPRSMADNKVETQKKK